MKTYADKFLKIFKIILAIFLIIFSIGLIAGIVVSIIFRFDALHGLMGPIFIVGALLIINRAIGFAFLNDIYVSTGSYRISGNVAYKESAPLETQKFLKRKMCVGFIASLGCGILTILNIVFAFIPAKNFELWHYILFIFNSLATGLFMFFVIGMDSYHKIKRK